MQGKSLHSRKLPRPHKRQKEPLNGQLKLHLPQPLLPQRKHKPRQLKRSEPLLRLLKKHRESQPQPQPQLRRE